MKVYFLVLISTLFTEFEICLSEKKNGEYFRHYCRETFSAGPLGNMVCCSDNFKVKVRCLPQVIIAGAQKSGTTVLSAILARHPNINFSKKKELHFFDRTENFNRGIKSYLENFRSLYNSAEVKSSSNLKIQTSSKAYTEDQLLDKKAVYNSSLVIVGMESSPFYIASPDACQRISQYNQHTRLIILLREPISRAYSEYQMKKRRVNAQEVLISIVNKHSAEVRGCFIESGGKVDDVPKCIQRLAASPSIGETAVRDLNELLASIGWNKVLRYLKKTAKSKKWNVVISNCFVSEEKLFGKNPHRRALLLSNHSNADNALFERIAPEHYSDAETSLSTENSFTSSFSSVKEHAFWSMNRSGLLEKRNLDTSNKTRYFFDLKRCSGHSPEYANTLDDALLKEAKSFLQCAKEAIPGIDIKTAKQFSEAVDQCVKVKHGITSQYVYRSMYAPQLYKCSRHIPLEQMLILSSDEMRTNLTSFISKITSFLNVPPHYSPSELLSLNQEEIVKETFPSMLLSGWEQSGVYDPLPEHIHDELKAFFKPFNDALFEFLGQTPYVNW